MESLRVLIADDHETVRAGVRALLEGMRDCEVVGEAWDADSALAAVRELEPDLIVLDLGMPGSGVRTIQTILEERPATRILVFTMYADSVYLRAVINAGAHGYLTKNAASSEFKRAVRAVAAGRMLIDSAFKLTPGDQAVQQVALSPREIEVLRALAEGYTQREIAERMDLSARTVETYRARVSEKLQLKSRAELVRYALETGILRPTP